MILHPDEILSYVDFKRIILKLNFSKLNDQRYTEEMWNNCVDRL